MAKSEYLKQLSEEARERERERIEDLRARREGTPLPPGPMRYMSPEMQKFNDEESWAFRELTRTFAEERGLSYLPLFNLGYMEWPEADQRDFDELARAFNEEWGAKRQARFHPDTTPKER